MSTMRVAAAAVTGARHLRTARNGQDAAAAWSEDDMAVVVVCDGCGSGQSSEVGARLGAQLVVNAVRARLVAGQSPADPTLWTAVREEVAGALTTFVDALHDRSSTSNDQARREQLIHDHFLFTIVVAAVRGVDVAVWAIGDGTYAIGDREQVLGPFPDNQPPYLAYDLLGAPPPAHFVTTTVVRGCVIVATDGVAELGLDALGGPAERERFLVHPDALRRRLALLARANERVDWDERRIERVPALLQDDGAVGMITWRVPS